MIFRFGAYELDEEAGELRHRGDPVEIQPKPFALLQLLLRERARIVPLDELFERLWPETAVTPGSLTRAVSLARRAIGDTHRGSMLRSFSRRGYRFCGEVIEVGAPPAAATATTAAAPGPSAPVSAAARPLRFAPETEPLVGREEALAALRAELDDAIHRRGGLAYVTGPPGVGKTRLVEAFAQEAAAQGPSVVVARAREGEGVPAFWLWAQVLRRLVQEETFGDALRALGPVAGEISVLVPELGAAPGDEPAPSAERRRFVFFDAVGQALARCGRERPLAIVLEDVQWAGDASLRLLEHLAFELRDARVLLVVTVRDEPRDRSHPVERLLTLLRRQSHGRPVELRSFSRGEVAQLLERTLGRRPPPDLTSELYARTEGVPLFLREALRLLAERGDLRHPERVVQQGLALPAHTFDFIQRALDGLEPETLSLVRIAAVIGRDFPLALVAAVAGVERSEALDRLDEAEAAGVVEPCPEAPATWRFAHALFQEAAYEGLSAGQRARLHQSTADHLAEQHRAEPDAVIAELAHHLHRGIATGDPERAWQAARSAAAKAQRLLAYEQAAVHLEQAAAALEHFPSVDPELRLDTLLALGEAYRTAGEHVRRREVFREAMEVARSLDRPAEFARAAVGYCDISEWWPRNQAAEASFTEVLGEALRRLGVEPSPTRARLVARLAFVCVLESRERAEPLARQAVTLAREAGDPGALQEALYTLHFAIGGPDDMDERDALVDEMIETARASGGLDTTVIALVDVASDRIQCGDAAGSRRRREEAGRVAGSRPPPTMVWHLRVFDAGVALLEGRFDEARALTEEALGLGRRIDHPLAVGCYNAHRTWIARDQGDLETVLRLFERATRQYRGPTEWTRAVVGRALAELGREDEARSLFESIAAEDFAAIPRNLRWANTLVEAAHLCVELGDHGRARALARLLEPVEHQHGVLAVPVCYGGPVAFARARLLAQLGERDDALSLLEDAADTCTALGARPMLARVALEHGALLARAGDRSRARERLDTAVRLAKELGLAPVLSAAEARLG